VSHNILACLRRWDGHRAQLSLLYPHLPRSLRPRF